MCVLGLSAGSCSSAVGYIGVLHAKVVEFVLVLQLVVEKQKKLPLAKTDIFIQSVFNPVCVDPCNHAHGSHRAR